MLRDLADEYEVVRRTIAEANEVLRKRLGRTYEQLMFTASRSPEERQALEQTMTARSDIAQPVLVTASVALHRLVTAHGVRFDTFAGHSLGEYAALVCAGVLDFGQAIGAAHARGEAFRDLATRSGDAGLMATVTADAHTVAMALEGIEGYVAIANRNCPQQTVVSGDTRAVRDAVARIEAQGMECRVLPIAGAFHSRVAEAVVARMEPVVAALDVRAPTTRVLSSVDLAYYEPSMDCAERVRLNLVRQLVTPVDFIGVVDRLHVDGIRMFIEIGPKNALAAFVDDILKDTRAHRTLFVNHPKAGEVPQLDRFMAHHALLDASRTLRPPVELEAIGPTVSAETTRRAPSRPASGERIWITGVSVGLPGTTSRVFSDGGLDRLLGGACFIEPVPDALQDRMVAKRITRLVKTEDGEPYLAEVTTRDDVVKLAGQRGGFSLRDDFGLDEEWLAYADISTQLAVAAGLECLRDARIPCSRRIGAPRAAVPCVPVGCSRHRCRTIPPWCSRRRFLDSTPRDELGRYYRATFGAASASAARNEYLQRLQTAGTEEERLQADQWFMDERRRVHVDGAVGPYRFNRNFLSDYLCMGNTRFAQLVRARGPNLAVNAACSSTAVALATAEDMIRAGRARRVVVLAADDVSSDVVLEWVGAGFLAAGAAATDRNVADAAIPFDRRRHGMVVGMGAVGFVIEADGAARERGFDPVAELLGVRLANSASHMTRPDTNHVIAEMTAFLADMRDRHGLDPTSLAPSLVYGSHETFTLPSGGIGAVEGRMLKQVFGDRWRDVLVVNTKCSTGHAQGASLEDAIIIKGLQAGRVPPVLHTTEIDPELAGISQHGRSTTRGMCLQCGIRLQVSMLLRGYDAARTARRLAHGIGANEVTGFRNATAVKKRVLRWRPSAVDGIARRPVGGTAHACPGCPTHHASARTRPRGPGRPAAHDAGGRSDNRVGSQHHRSRDGDHREDQCERRSRRPGPRSDLGIDAIKQAQVMGRFADVALEDRTSASDFTPSSSTGDEAGSSAPSRRAGIRAACPGAGRPRARRRPSETSAAGGQSVSTSTSPIA
jgi:malonyl CoA-acyl carrier protein transacylase